MALGFMRRHRRWLFVFLWLVIAAFIILYIPAFQDGRRRRPGRGGGRGGRGAHHRRRVPARLPAPAAALRAALPGPAGPRAMLQRLGLEEQVFERPGRRARLVPLEARAARPRRATTRRWRARSGHCPDSRRTAASWARDEIRRRLELQGVTVQEFEESLRDALLRERLRALVTDGVARDARGGRARVPPPQRAGQGRIRAGGRGRRREADGHRRRGEGRASRRDARTLPHPREARRRPTCWWTRPRCSRGSPSPTREIEAYYQEHRDEFTAAGRGLRQPHPGEGQGQRPTRPRATPRRRPARLAQAALDQVKGGRRLRGRGRQGLRGRRARRRRAATWAASRRGRMVPEFEQRGLRPAARRRSPTS